MLNDKEQTLTGFDFLNMENFLMDEQKAVRDEAREFVQHEVLPNINPYWEKAEFPREIAMKLGKFSTPIIGGSRLTYQFTPRTLYLVPRTSYLVHCTSYLVHLLLTTCPRPTHQTPAGPSAGIPHTLVQGRRQR